MNKLTVIENVKCYLDQNGTAWLNLEDVARGLGFTERKPDGAEYVRWNRVSAYLREYGFATSGENGFIPENIFYLLAMKANNETAITFQMKVANEILPAIRRTGTYSVQPMTELQILRAAIDHLEATRKEAAEAKQLAESTQEQFRELKDVIIHHDKDWRNWVNAQLQKVGFITGDYSTARTDSYKHLEERARCRLSVRLGNLRDRLRREGATPTMVNKTNYMDVIEVEPRLKEIYTTIVKELAIRYAS
jgi:prophage antirepressor-like protein